MYREKELPPRDSFPNQPQWPELNQSKAWSQEPLPGLPRGCRNPRLWAVLKCFPRSQAGSWMGSGTARIRTSIHMRSQHVQDEDFQLLGCCARPKGTILKIQIEMLDVKNTLTKM